MLEFLKKKKKDKNPGNNNDSNNESEVEIPEVDGTLNAIDAALALDQREQERKVKEAAEKVKAEQRAREEREAGSRCGCW